MGLGFRTGERHHADLSEIAKQDLRGCSLVSGGRTGQGLVREQLGIGA